MSKLQISWSSLQKSGIKALDCWDEIKNVLNNIMLSNGCVTLDKLDDDGYLISEIQVRMDGGVYLVTFLNEGDEVMTLSDLTQSDEKVLISGDYWSIRQTTKDFDLVVRIFKEFFDTGNVSTDILN